MAKLTGDMIKAGLHVWAVGYNNKERKEVPVELIIVTGELEELVRNAYWVQVATVLSGDKLSAYEDDEGKIKMSVADRGIRPYNYDNRCTQIFTTKEELVAAMELWNGRNPNFVTEDGDSIERGYVPNQAHYDYYEEE